ncbi:MAG TPA: MmcQ/YjbR family DNA-binding protein [Rhodothermales bacterium]|nr:MmcQ/YjbR family DNA-binding protein [Rhodothermales bacterium]
MSLTLDPGSDPLTLASVRTLILSFPGMEEGTSYGTPGFRTGGKLLVRMHQDGEALVVRVDPSERETLMEGDPVTFYITDHYRNHPWVLVCLSTVSPAELRDLIEKAWRKAAPKRLVAAFDAR